METGTCYMFVHLYCSIVHLFYEILFYSMIHGLRIKDGKATYLSRYVKTSRLEQEKFFGGAKFMKVFI